MKEFPGGVAVALKLALSVTPRPARSDFDRDFVLLAWGVSFDPALLIDQ